MTLGRVLLQLDTGRKIREDLLTFPVGLNIAPLGRIGHAWPCCGLERTNEHRHACIREVQAYEPTYTAPRDLMESVRPSTSQSFSLPECVRFATDTESTQVILPTDNPQLQHLSYAIFGGCSS